MQNMRRRFCTTAPPVAIGISFLIAGQLPMRPMLEAAIPMQVRVTKTSLAPPHNLHTAY